MAKHSPQTFSYFFYFFLYIYIYIYIYIYLNSSIWLKYHKYETELRNKFRYKMK